MESVAGSRGRWEEGGMITLDQEKWNETIFVNLCIQNLGRLC